MKCNELFGMIKEFEKILKVSKTKAQFSMNCTLHGQSVFLSEKFRTFLFDVFTIENLDKPGRAIYRMLLPDFKKINDFYNDGKILLNLT